MSQGVQVGSILDGKIVKIKPFGAIVSLPDGVQGLVHISQISESFVQDVNDVFAVGDAVMVKVLSKDKESGKITLSIKAALAESGSHRSEQTQGGGDAKPQRTESSRDFDSKPKYSDLTFDEKLKDWIKQSNERQAGINKRNNRR